MNPYPSFTKLKFIQGWIGHDPFSLLLLLYALPLVFCLYDNGVLRIIIMYQNVREFLEFLSLISDYNTEIYPCGMRVLNIKVKQIEINVYEC